MWRIINETPFAVKGAVRQDLLTNKKIWLVAVKATFDISEKGGLSVSKDQLEVFEDPVYMGEDETSSMQYDSDLFGFKDYVDILVNGTGYQPDGKAGKDLLVGFTVGHCSKTLRLVGNRLWDRFFGLTLKIGPQPFVQMPIRYENAFGGKDETAKPERQWEYRNTVGKGYAWRKRNLKGKRLPNIEYPEFPTKPKAGKNRVAGFGAIPVFWKQRADLAGTFDEEWEKSRSPFVPLDFSKRYLQSAFPDQQVNHLSGGEQVSLYNLTGSRPEFRFHLPDITFKMTTKIDLSVYAHESNIKTVIIEPDVSRLVMVWQSFVDCQDRDHLVDRTVVDCEILQL